VTPVVWCSRSRRTPGCAFGGDDSSRGLEAGTGRDAASAEPSRGGAERTAEGHR
jgi:hypothetical protein